MRKNKAGVAGIGFIGAVHVEALRRLNNVEVIAIADSNEKIARFKAEELCIDMVTMMIWSTIPRLIAFISVHLIICIMKWLRKL